MYTNNIMSKLTEFKKDDDDDVLLIEILTEFTKKLQNKGYMQILNNFKKSKNINQKDSYGWNFLMLASRQGDIGIVKLLLEKGAIIDEKDNTGSTALMFASYLGHISVVNLLLESGADVNLTNNNGDTSLMRASLGKYLDVVKLLLAYGANIEVQNRYGDTALHYACKQKMGVSNIPIITELLKYGADPNTINNNKKKPIEVFQGTEDDKKEVENLIKESILLYGVKTIDFSIGENNNPFSANVPFGFENFENLKKYMGGRRRKSRRRKSRKIKSRRRK